MTMLKMFIKLGFAAMLVELAMAANYTVGGPNSGWDTGSNVQTWASSRSFAVGDNLIFQYSANHDVVEVSKQNYDSCQASSAINSHSDGNTVIALSSPGKRYFICGTPGHCSSGMKVEIDTLATATPTPSPASPANPPSAATPVTPTASPAPETSPTSVAPNLSPAPETSTSLPDVPVTVTPATSPSSPVSPPPPSSGARDSFRVNLTTGMGGVVLMMTLLAF
ncbi:uclacyanin 1-like [Tripterygium wilfordii]|uniref:uclacyanin 1-like n=1 Tax=Tripterygium wilfordii TaxID=458696 RepID=UPI0018F80987|nr:uclacyanin 1-like [Tripterygium wilfordii]